MASARMGLTMRASRAAYTTQGKTLPEGFHQLSEEERFDIFKNMAKDVPGVDPYHSHETPEEFDHRWTLVFADPRLDAWMLEERLNELFANDVVPAPEVLSSALHATRRLDDFAMSVRILEGVRDKAQDDNTYNWVIQSLRPTIEELGLSTPEELNLCDRAADNLIEGAYLA